MKVRTTGRATRFPTGPRGLTGRRRGRRGAAVGCSSPLSFHDPPRADAAYAIRVAKELGVRVVIVSGGDAREARELCRAVGLPTHVAGAECLDVPLDLVRPTTTTNRTAMNPQTDTTSSGTYSIPHVLEAERAGAFAAMSRLDQQARDALADAVGVCAMAWRADATLHADVSVASRAA